MTSTALVDANKDESFHAASVRDCRNFDKRSEEGMHYPAIREILTKAANWYKIGNRPFGQKKPKRSLKELAISQFNATFGSQFEPRYGSTCLRP